MYVCMYICVCMHIFIEMSQPQASIRMYVCIHMPILIGMGQAQVSICISFGITFSHKSIYAVSPFYSWPIIRCVLRLASVTATYLSCVVARSCRFTADILYTNTPGLLLYSNIPSHGYILAQLRQFESICWRIYWTHITAGLFLLQQHQRQAYTRPRPAARNPKWKMGHHRQTAVQCGSWCLDICMYPCMLCM